MTIVNKPSCVRILVKASIANNEFLFVLIICYVIGSSYLDCFFYLFLLLKPRYSTLPRQVSLKAVTALRLTSPVLPTSLPRATMPTWWVRAMRWKSSTSRCRACLRIRGSYIMVRAEPASCSPSRYLCRASMPTSPALAQMRWKSWTCPIQPNRYTKA